MSIVERAAEIVEEHIARKFLESTEEAQAFNDGETCGCTDKARRIVREVNYWMDDYHYSIGDENTNEAYYNERKKKICYRKKIGR